MSKKRVLFIVYYWPPSGGAGVQRCLKMVKYMREFGWEPVVFSPANPAYPVFDETLAADIPAGIEQIQAPIWEPYNLYKVAIGQKKGQVYSGFMSEGKKQSFSQRASIWLRGNLFIPDARMFWVKPATRFLKKYLKAHPVDAMITSGPPHSVHLIGRNIKRSTGLPWISDFRDPWTNIDFYDQLMLSSWADRKHHRLEKQVLTEADKVTTVTWSLADELRELGGKDHVEVITNGFDHADFEHIDTQPAAEFLISHIGSINKDRNAPELWQAIAKLCLENQAFADAVRLRFIGKTDGALRADIETTGLSDKVSYIEYLPHKEIPERLRESQVLLLLLNDTPNVRGIAPGKMYEYLASGRPILATGPSDGDAARIISQANAGTMCDFGDQEAMEKVLLGFFERYQQGRLSVSHNDINRYSRKHTTGQMAALLDDLTA